MLKTLRLACAIATLVTATTSAQDYSALAKSMPKLESQLAIHLGQSTSFKGRMELKVTHSDGRVPFVLPATVYLADNKLRCELLGQEGKHGGNAVFIYDATRRELIVADTEQRTYREVKMSASALDAFAAEKLETRLSLVPIGTETVNGQVVSKTKGSVKRGEREVGRSTVWHTKVGGVQVPVQIETGDTNQVTTLTFSEIQVGGIESGKFQVPTNYRKVVEKFAIP